MKYHGLAPRYLLASVFLDAAAADFGADSGAGRLKSARSRGESAGVAGATACRQDCVVTYMDRIVRDPAICAGQPVIRGTRVMVRVVLGYLAHGETTEHILGEFPSLTQDDVRAVIAFAAASAGEDLPAPSPIPPNAQVA